MLTSKEREQAFRADLEALLVKHKAYLDITTDYYGRRHITVTMYNRWNDKGKLVAEHTEFII